ncbi:MULTISPECIES: MarR family winged helix-turn-helix transcriptional regulator [Erwiniaceae]|jgi:DNA-binding MarR family transcriptional regulator|uniref:MarR family transcriptional regulator n=1 Tax=Enterobacter agglomerans TaxID=549 RepID=A0ACC5RR29_ENTAG|nr:MULTISPECIES: MarR family transcriptional regulator [Erwiniaceae]MBK4727119.1 MarR family transcriptional regulator [Pantoea agglomerans]NKG29847.1 MarR family transcriptional regulator [Erwinia rhapontici]
MSETQEKLSTLALTTFALNGLFLTVAEQLTAPVGITATRWQVIGAVLKEPLTQSEIARRMGITRQSVRRTSLQLVAEGMLYFTSNPSSRKAMLLHPTEKGYAVVNKISPQHAAFAKQLEDRIGKDKMAEIIDAMTGLRNTLEEIVRS